MRLCSLQSLRIYLLLLLLATAIVYTQDQQLTAHGWYQPLPVVIFPINGDGSRQTADYIASLKPSDFSDIDRFVAGQAERYHVVSTPPIITNLGNEVGSIPPRAPTSGSNVTHVMAWSLRLRWWAWWSTPDKHSNRDRIRIFVVYHQGREGKPLAHSLGLRKGLIGVVHAYARRKQTRQNHVVIAHELLHTLGASDKYGPDGRPRYPGGFANPNREPLYPQRRAEIMAGRIALSATQAETAPSLARAVIGRQTAREIHWLSARPD